MKRIFLIVILLIGKEAIAQKSVGIASVPATESNSDWLIQSTNYKATIAKSTDSKEIVLDNGLVRRVFRPHS